MAGDIPPMRAPVTIRRATVADARAIAELHVWAWAWAYRGLLPDAFLQRLAATLDRRVEARRANLADEPPEQRTWVAEQGGQVVGFAIISPRRDADATPQTGEVQALYLAPHAVGTGTGRALFAHAVDDLRRRGYGTATLWVLESNARGRRFYEAAGWTPDGATKAEEGPGVCLREVRYRAVLGRDDRRAARRSD